MPQVQRIDPIVLPGTKERVAAYCRVSTDSADQMNSYHTQITYYTKLIADNPDWELADIYADAGITGTSIEKRDEFKRMIADCREGKIQRVLVKSVSRFARNTTELLETTRELKGLGVVVVFEEQGFDTSQMMGEMLLTMQAMAAQEESQSISKNMIWSYQKRMQNGTYITNCAPFGYSLISSSELAIVPNEAKIVKNIYDLYLSGIGQREIVRILNAEQIPYRNGQQWTYSKVKAVLSNEKYYGDSILQKKYTVDALSHYRQRNNGQRQQYYVQGSQPAIIPKDKYDKVRALAAIRKNNQATRHLFTHRIICPDCNRHYREVNANRKSYWLCPYKANGLSPCKAPRISESNITQAAINMMVKLYLHQDNILSPTIAHLREIEYTQTGNDSKLYELDKSIADLNDKVLMLQKLNSKGFISADEYRLRSEKLSVERQKLTAARNKKLNGLQSHSAIEKLEELQAILAAWPGIPTEFDIEQFDEIVEKIIPTENNALIFRLHCGLELTEAIPE
ncbi:recombinase family protein [Acutalibacter muris]|uniref:recombinase family protein n=1 Tax=Acutalibacter muris TaxID=1796620 RepID=UPI001C3EBDA6|nr:recombinase family protein [Acutalibacter muris]